MSGRYMPIGQIMPSSQNASTQQLPKFNTQPASDLSFQNVLNRQQMTSAQLKAQSPQYSSQFTAQPLQQNHGTAKGIVGTSPLTQNQAVQNMARGSAYGFPGNNQGSNQQVQVMPPDAMEAAQQNMPANPPDASVFDQAMVQNLKDYQAMKQQESVQPAISRPSLPGAKQIEAAGPQGNGNLQGGTASAFNSALSRNHNQFQSNAFNDQQQVSENESISDDSLNLEDDSVETDTQNVNPNKKPNMLLAESREEGPITNHKRRVRQEDEIPIDAAEKPRSQKRGLFGNIGAFFQDIATGVTFGVYHPQGEEVPTGVGRIVYPIKKLAFDAPVKDIALGIPGGIYNDVTSGSKRKNSTAETKEATTAAPAFPMKSSVQKQTKASMEKTDFPAFEESVTKTEKPETRWRTRFSVDSDRPDYAASRRK